MKDISHLLNTIKVNLSRRFWFWMYKAGLYKAKLNPDGKTDNSRAIQTQMDAGGVRFVQGTYMLKKPLYYPIEEKNRAKILAALFRPNKSFLPVFKKRQKLNKR